MYPGPSQTVEVVPRTMRAPTMLLALLAIGFSAGCLPEKKSAKLDPPDALPALGTDGRWIRDPYGRAVFLRGANYSHRSKQPPWTSWMKDDHAEVQRVWGFNCVRLLLQWEALEPEKDHFDEAYLDAIAAAAKAYRDRGLYVVLDMHQDLWARPFGGDGAPVWATIDDLVEPNVHHDPWGLTYFTTEVRANFMKLWTDPTLQDEFADAWAKVAERFKGVPGIAAFDLFNEPMPGDFIPGAFEAAALQPFYHKVIDRIRAIDASRQIWIEPTAMTGIGVPTFLKPFGKPNLVYAPHWYDAYFQMSATYIKWPTEAGFALHEKQARDIKTPWVLGEWGTFLHLADATKYFADHLSLQDRWLVSGSLFWNFNPLAHESETLEKDTFSPIDASGAEHAVVDLLVRVNPRFVAGTPKSISWDTSAKTFRIAWEQPVGGAVADYPTVLWIPEARHYPGGFTIVSTDRPGKWSHVYDKTSGLLKVWSDPSTPYHELTIKAK